MSKLKIEIDYKENTIKFITEAGHVSTGVLEDMELGFCAPINKGPCYVSGEGNLKYRITNYRRTYEPELKPAPETKEVTLKLKVDASELDAAEERARKLSEQKWIYDPEAPHKCPVCEGRGLVRMSLFDDQVPDTVPCHGCGGKGWVR